MDTRRAALPLKNGGDKFCIIYAGGVCVFSQSGRVIFTETDEGSQNTAEHGAERVICFRGMQTVPVAARNERLTPPQRIVTQIIRDFPGARTGQW